MPDQLIKTHVAILGGVCLLLLLFLAGAKEPAPPSQGALTPTFVIVNKQNPIEPLGYVPSDLEAVGSIELSRPAARALRELLADARADGVPITTVSGYRSFATQKDLHRKYRDWYGNDGADDISARPGHSEHQTGLAVDLGNPDGKCALQACFEDTPAGSWIRANASTHGFIIRYPQGHQGVTGYTYEPWHLRYVGSETAVDFKDSGAATLEDYLGMPPAPHY